jgi:SAM-dependent methyltransferase
MPDDTLRRIKRFAEPLVASVRAWVRMAPAKAFDLWSATYDDQVTNPLLLLDDDLIGRLLGNLQLENKVIVDVGCGSGRHWQRLLARRPRCLIGVDASAGMLARLRAKYPNADLRHVTDHRLYGTPDESCDLVISTLTFGYIADAEGTFREWARVLRPAGDVVLTDLHPDAATPNARSFRQGDRTIAIWHQSRALTSITAAAARSGLEVLRIETGLVGESIRSAYEAAAARALYDEQKGSALMFGMHLTKRDKR